MAKIKEGYAAVSPDGRVAVMYTPDAVWLGREIQNAAVAGTLSSVFLDNLIKESLQRPEILNRESHPTRQIVKDNQVGEDVPG